MTIALIAWILIALVLSLMTRNWGPLDGSSATYSHEYDKLVLTLALLLFWPLALPFIIHHVHTLLRKRVR